MKVSGTATLDAPVEKVWESILDPNVLVRTIPGCERLEETGENAYSASVTAGVASIKGTYEGKVQLSNLQPHESLMMRAEGASAAGTIGVDVAVTFKDLGNGTTQLDYDADAVVGGMIGGVGQRMLTSVGKRIANEFFGNVNKVLTGQVPVDAAPAAASGEAAVAADGAPAPKSYGAPAPVAVASDGQDFLKGLVAGAVIALLGVLAGAIAARRR